jgi:hypothetical protein
MSPNTRAKYGTPIADRRLEEVRRLFERYRRVARERDAVLPARPLGNGSQPRSGATRGGDTGAA